MLLSVPREVAAVDVRPALVALGLDGLFSHGANLNDNLELVFIDAEVVLIDAELHCETVNDANLYVYGVKRLTFQGCQHHRLVD